MAVMDQGIQYVVGLVFIGIIVGVGAITLNSLMTGSAAFPLASHALNNSSFALMQMAQQLPTVGTIMGVALILIVLFSALGFLIMKGRD